MTDADQSTAKQKRAFFFWLSVPFSPAIPYMSLTFKQLACKEGWIISHVPSTSTPSS